MQYTLRPLPISIQRSFFTSVYLTCTNIFNQSAIAENLFFPPDFFLLVMNSFIHVSVISVYQSSRYSVCRRIIIALILTLAKDFCRSVTQSCLTLRPHGLQHTGLSCSSPSPGVCANLFFTFVPLFYFLDSLYK